MAASRSAASTEQDDRTLRIGVVGAGAVAHRHVRTLAGFDDVAVVAMTDVDTRRAAELAERCGARTYASCEEMVGAGALDAVYVCIPPFAHGPPELVAIEAGLPLFIEKPIAIDVPTAETIAGAVRDGGVVTAVGYHWRYLDTVEEVRALLQQTPPRLVAGYWLDRIPPAPWWRVGSRSGGQIIEQATHVLDLMRFLVGEVDEVHARGSATQNCSDFADVTSATLTLRDGALGTMATTCLLPARHRVGLDIFCEGTAIELSEETLAVSGREHSTRRAAAVDAKALADRAFLDAVKGRPNRIRSPYADALASHRLACEVARSEDRATASLARRPPTPAAPAETARSLGIARPGRATLFDLPLEPVTEGGFRVQTLYTGLSAGTELTFLKGTNPVLRDGYDRELGVFGESQPSDPYPIRTLGYMEVGRVLAARTEAVRPGQRLAMAFGHKSAHTADALRERFVAIPDDLDPLLGVYVAHMGPICANGLLHAAAELVGSDVRTLGDGVRGLDVLVTGAGVVGLLTALFALEHGAAAVTIADTSELRLRAARGLGLDAVDSAARAVWRVVKARHRHGPGDRGADVAFQCRARSESLADALRSLRPQGAVIDLAFYIGGAPSLRLGEEFHHNGLSLRSAQIGRVPRALAPRWHRDRLSNETIALLRARGADIRRELITDIVSLDAAPALLEDVAARRREVVQAIIEIDSEAARDLPARPSTSA